MPYPCKYLHGHICTVFTCCLLVNVVLKFTVIRPTSTSEEKVRLVASTFPNVLACVDPPYNQSILEKHGYPTGSYYRGGSLDRQFIGWNGMDGKQNSTKILNDILIVKEDEVPIDNINFYDKNGKKKLSKIGAHWLKIHQKVINT